MAAQTAALQPYEDDGASYSYEDRSVRFGFTPTPDKTVSYDGTALDVTLP